MAFDGFWKCIASVDELELDPCSKNVLYGRFISSIYPFNSTHRVQHKHMNTIKWNPMFAIPARSSYSTTQDLSYVKSFFKTFYTQLQSSAHAEPTQKHTQTPPLVCPLTAK